ncbi:CinA family protein [Kitasatospora sp. NPDC058263]
MPPDTGRTGHGGQDGSRGLDPAGVLVRQITSALAAAGHSVAAAESLTGGRLAVALSDAPGSGATFLGGVVAYATDLKTGLLHVDAALVGEVGAVHPEVAAQMAQGVRALTQATYGLATTGVAGPAPQDGQPVGTVFVAVAAPHATIATQPEPRSGHRNDIQNDAVVAALQLLHDLLRPD